MGDAGRSSIRTSLFGRSRGRLGRSIWEKARFLDCVLFSSRLKGLVTSLRDLLDNVGDGIRSVEDFVSIIADVTIEVDLASIVFCSSVDKGIVLDSECLL